MKNMLTIDSGQSRNPIRIRFANHNVTEYVYAADGRRLKTTHRTSVPRSDMLGIGGTATLTASETMSVDSAEYIGNFICDNGTPKRYCFDDGYLMLYNTTFTQRYYIKDHLGNNRMVVNGAGAVYQNNNCYPYGGMTALGSGQGYQQFKYNGKEYDPMHGLDEYDYGARQYDPAIGRFTTIDPLCEKYYHISPYTYCAGNPVMFVDPDGRDWYKNNKTSYYTWYNGDKERQGFTHIGGKGSVLGKFENIINNVLCGEGGLGLESLYSNGFAFDISPNDKGGLIGSKERGWDFFDEFVNGSGPEFSVLLGDHPYTQTIMEENFVKSNQEVIKLRGSNGKYTNVARSEFFPWQAGPLSPMQYIGTYRYDGYTSKDGRYINNVATDSKSVTSLGYHITFFNNHRRSQRKEFGNTYQFYIWRTKR